MLVPGPSALSVNAALRIRSVIEPHRLAHGAQPVALQAIQQFALDAAHQARPLEHQRGIELHQGRAGADLGIGVGPARDAADADDAAACPGSGDRARRRTPVEGSNKRPAAQAARLAMRSAGRARMAARWWCWWR